MTHTSDRTTFLLPYLGVTVLARVTPRGPEPLHYMSEAQAKAARDKFGSGQVFRPGRGRSFYVALNGLPLEGQP